MKRRFFTSLLAVVLAVVTAFSLVGCQEESNAVSQLEFMRGVKNSYDNYVAAYYNYDTFGNITVTADYDSYSMVNERDYSYTPDGGETVTGTYRDEMNVDTIATISFKRIDGELFLTSEYVREMETVTHELTETSLTKNTENSTFSEKYEFGVYGGVYFVRLVSTSKVNDEDAVTTKTYEAFASKSDYVMAMTTLINNFNSYYGDTAFEALSTGSDLDEMIFLLAKYSKVDEVYRLDLDYAGLILGDDRGDAEVANINMDIEYGNKGAVSLCSLIDYGYMKISGVVNFKYSSSLNSIANPADGFTEGTVGELSAIAPIGSAGSM